MNRGKYLHFGGMRNVNRVKSTEKYVVCTEKNVYKWVGLFKDEDRQGKSTMASACKEWIQLMRSILVDRRIIEEDISEQLGISVDTQHKIMHDDLSFSKANRRLVLPR